MTIPHKKRLRAALQDYVRDRLVGTLFLDTFIGGELVIERVEIEAVGNWERGNAVANRLVMLHLFGAGWSGLTILNVDLDTLEFALPPGKEEA